MENRGQASLPEALDDFTIRPPRVNTDNLPSESRLCEHSLEHTDLCGLGRSTERREVEANLPDIVARWELPVEEAFLYRTGGGCAKRMETESHPYPLVSSEPGCEESESAGQFGYCDDDGSGCLVEGVGGAVQKVEVTMSVDIGRHDAGNCRRSAGAVVAVRSQPRISFRPRP